MTAKPETAVAVIDYSATTIEWRAAGSEEARHAFPSRDGFPAPSLCGLRWTVRYGHHGAGACLTCIVALRDQITAASMALSEIERGELAAGDHYRYAGPSR